jgi:predicted phage baseplate assembly protein
MSGYDYGSTLTVYVDGTAWAAVPSLYDASPTDRVYIAFEDDAQQTHVRFGDGVHGARLPTGVGNVTATYRYGSGADAPGIGTLTNIVKPYPKLQSVRNPIAAVGGADPQSPADGMRNATSSMRFLGRAVSIDDYATLAAAQTPTVVCARAFPVTGTERRYSAIAVYVGGLPTDVESAAAVSVAQSALKQYGAPDQRVAVLPASRKAMSVELNVVTDPNHDATTVPADVRSAVTDLLSGKTRPGVVGIGDVLFNGEIFAACLYVLGVKAIDGFHFYLKTKDTITEDPLPTHSPGRHGFYQLMDPENDLKVTVNGQ